jgi:hypothetical protein
MENKNHQYLNNKKAAGLPTALYPTNSPKVDP